MLDDPAFTGPTPNLVGAALVSDTGAAAATRTFTFTPIFGQGPGMTAPLSAAAAPHQFFLQADLNCSAGAGATLDRTIIDVVEHR